MYVVFTLLWSKCRTASVSSWLRVITISDNQPERANSVKWREINDLQVSGLDPVRLFIERELELHFTCTSAPKRWVQNDHLFLSPLRSKLNAIHRVFQMLVRLFSWCPFPSAQTLTALDFDLQEKKDAREIIYSSVFVIFGPYTAYDACTRHGSLHRW